MLANLSIKSRLVFVIGFLSLLLVGIGILGLTSLNSTNGALRSVYEDRTVALGRLAQISMLVNQNQITLSGVTAGQLSAFPDDVAIVDKNALALASRRAALETESATDYAKAFSEDELKAIAAFYSSPAGQKLLEKGPEVTAELTRAAQIWQRGIARDLAEAVAKDMEAKHPLKNTAPVADGANGAEPQQDSSKKQ